LPGSSVSRSGRHRRGSSGQAQQRRCCRRPCRSLLPYPWRHYRHLRWTVLSQTGGLFPDRTVSLDQLHVRDRRDLVLQPNQLPGSRRVPVGIVIETKQILSQDCVALPRHGRWTEQGPDSMGVSPTFSSHSQRDRRGITSRQPSRRPRKTVRRSRRIRCSRCLLSVAIRSKSDIPRTL
jgi:hypothetical protein